MTCVPALAAQKIISAFGKKEVFNSSVEPSPASTSTPNLLLYSSDFLDYQKEYFHNSCDELSFMAYRKDSFLFQLPLFKFKNKLKFFNNDEYLEIPNNLLELFFKKKNIWLANKFF